MDSQQFSGMMSIRYSIYLYVCDAIKINKQFYCSGLERTSDGFRQERSDRGGRT
jgi:hypothetical protein